MNASHTLAPLAHFHPFSFHRNSYHEIVQTNHVDGRALLKMNAKEDWRKLGIVNFGDLRILGNTPVAGTFFIPAKTRIPRKSNSTPSSKAEGKCETKTEGLPSNIYSDNRRTQLLNLDGLDEVKHKPIIKLVDGYKPPHSCREHILNDLPSVFVNVDGIPSLVDDCILSAEENLTQLPSNIPRLTNDEALAIAAYSCDTGFKYKKNNIYYALNEVMRENDPKKVEKLLHFLS